jgi:hypothetical protein
MADLWQSLRALESQKTARRTFARVIDNGNYEIDILNKLYRIDLDNRKIFLINPASSGEHDGRLELPLLKYMTDAQPIDQAGEWVSPRDLPGGAQFLTGVHTVPVKKIIADFGENKNGFCAACKLLGGEPVLFADASFMVRLFPRFPVQVLLWLADDEFPARASMLVDRNAHLHMPLDAMLGAMGYLEHAIVTAIPKE